MHSCATIAVFVLQAFSGARPACSRHALSEAILGILHFNDASTASSWHLYELISVTLSSTLDP